MKISTIKTNEEFTFHFQNEIWLETAKQILKKHKIYFSSLKRVVSSDHVVFLIDNSFVLKIYRPFRNCFEREKKALEFVSRKISLKTPEIIEIGQFEGFDYLIETQIHGELMARQMWFELPENNSSQNSPFI